MSTEAVRSPFREQAVQHHIRGSVRGDVLHITPGLMS